MPGNAGGDYSRGMDVAFALALPIAFTAPAQAAPLAPPSGSVFAATEGVVSFVAQPDPGSQRLRFVFSTRRDLHAGRRLERSGASIVGVRMRRLVDDLDHVGQIWWRVCPAAVRAKQRSAGPEGCSAPRDLHVSFRVSTFPRAAVRSNARYVMRTRFGTPWRDADRTELHCDRISRTTFRCTVSVRAGDSSSRGVLIIGARRRKSWSASWFRGRVSSRDLTCVGDRSDCVTVQRERGYVVP